MLSTSLRCTVAPCPLCAEFMCTTDGSEGMKIKSLLVGLVIILRQYYYTALTELHSQKGWSSFSGCKSFKPILFSRKDKQDNNNLLAPSILACAGVPFSEGSVVSGNPFCRMSLPKSYLDIFLYF